ncbi:hypothetical protein [Streptomyces uncialis]
MLTAHRPWMAEGDDPAVDARRTSAGGGATATGTHLSLAMKLLSLVKQQ